MFCMCCVLTCDRSDQPTFSLRSTSIPSFDCGMQPLPERACFLKRPAVVVHPGERRGCLPSEAENRLADVASRGHQVLSHASGAEYFYGSWLRPLF